MDYVKFYCSPKNSKSLISHNAIFEEDGFFTVNAIQNLGGLKKGIKIIVDSSAIVNTLDKLLGSDYKISKSFEYYSKKHIFVYENGKDVITDNNYLEEILNNKDENKLRQIYNCIFKIDDDLYFPLFAINEANGVLKEAYGEDCSFIEFLGVYKIDKVESAIKQMIVFDNKSENFVFPNTSEELLKRAKDYVAYYIKNFKDIEDAAFQYDDCKDDYNYACAIIEANSKDVSDLKDFLAEAKLLENKMKEFITN